MQTNAKTGINLALWINSDQKCHIVTKIVVTMLWRQMETLGDGLFVTPYRATCARIQGLRKNVSQCVSCLRMRL